MDEKKSNVRIVVVDDSDFSRKHIIKIIEDQGLKVVGEANSAKTAMDIISKTSANIVIADIVMPDASGIELAKKFKDGFNEIYFIMISSLTLEQVIIESISAGASDFIQKPFKPEQLIQSVKRVIGLIGK